MIIKKCYTIFTKNWSFLKFALVFTELRAKKTLQKIFEKIFDEFFINWSGFSLCFYLYFDPESLQLIRSAGFRVLKTSFAIKYYISRNGVGKKKFYIFWKSLSFTLASNTNLALKSLQIAPRQYFYKYFYSFFCTQNLNIFSFSLRFERRKKQMLSSQKRLQKGLGDSLFFGLFSLQNKISNTRFFITIEWFYQLSHNFGKNVSLRISEN